MARGIHQRQKPAWQKRRKPLPPPSKPQSGKRGFRHKDFERKDPGTKKGLGGNK